MVVRRTDSRLEHALVLRSTTPLPESLAKRLLEMGTSGVWQVGPREWRAYFPEPDPTHARSLSITHPEVIAAWESSERTDWAARYHASLKPLPVGRRFTILPSPRIANPWPERIPLRLVPGTAFGTGEHYTTASCLRVIDEMSLVPGSVCDVGCGSGILAVAACKLGAPTVVACDTDPEACRVARRTRAVNRVSYAVVNGSAADVKGRFALVVANILAETLVEILPDLKSRTLPGGMLVGSGIAARKAEVVSGAAKKTGFEMQAVRSDGAWVTYVWKALKR